MHWGARGRVAEEGLGGALEVVLMHWGAGQDTQAPVEVLRKRLGVVVKHVLELSSRGVEEEGGVRGEALLGALIKALTGGAVGAEARGGVEEEGGVGGEALLGALIEALTGPHPPAGRL